MKEQFLNLSGLTDLVTYMKLCIAQHKVIIPRASFSLFPETGDENNIYIDTSTNAIYRWNDTDKKFVLLAKPPRTIVISEGTNNGEITLKVDNIASNAKVHGLTSTAFTESNKFATAAQGAKADSAVQTITLSSGTKNGTIKIKVNNITTDNIEVAGLGSAAFSDIGIFAAKSHTHKKDEVGLGNVDNTADINKSVKYATSAGAVSWKNITDKPTLFPPQQHNHDSLYYRKNEVDSLLSSKSDTGHTHVQFIQETKFSNGTYSDPLNGTDVAIKASGGIASDLIYEGGKTLADKYQAKGSYAASSHKQAYTSDECTSYESDSNTMGVTPAAVKKAFGIFGPKAHTHKKTDITDFPTSLPASDVYGWAKASSKPSYTKSEVGLGNVDNTADANKSVKYAGSSGSSNTIVYTALTNTNLNTLQTEGRWYYAGGGNTCTNIPVESAAFELYVGRNASGWRYQQFTVTSGEIYIRVFDSSNWGNWRKLAFTSDTVTAASSVPWSGITGKPSTFAPSSHNHTVIQGTSSTSAVPGKANDGFCEFYYNVNNGLANNMPSSNNANAIISISRHAGDYTSQLGFSSNGNLYYREGVGATAWKTILTSSNYTSYTVTKTGGGASGTWGINITGSAGSVAWGNVSGRPSSLPASDVPAWAKASTKPSYSWSEIGSKPSTFTPSSHNHSYLTLYGSRPANINFSTSTNGTGAMFHFVATSSTKTGKPPGDSNVLQMNWDNNGGWDTQFAISNGSSTHSYIRSQNNGTWGNWTTLLDSSNYNNYSPSKTGSGASGTWGINITGASGSCTGNAATASNASKVNGHTVNSDVPSGAKFTDTNTWRPLGTTADTACAGNDNRLSNARPASDVYSWAKASSKPSYSWSEITSKPSTFTPASHTHAYIPLSGGTITGSIIRSSGGSWISARNNVAVRGTATTKDSWNPVVGQATPNGYWTIGNLASNDNLAFSYTSNTNYNAGKNSATTVYLPVQEGTIITSATIGSQSVKYATSAGSAGSVAWGNVSGKPSSYTPSSHTHDDRYYTETEINTKLGAKLGAVSANGYYGMTRPDGNTSDWIRTTTAGIIPYQSGGAGAGHCGIGTSSWYFSNAYIDTVNCVNTNASGYLQANGLINTYSEYQSQKGSRDWRFGSATGSGDQNWFGFYDYTYGYHGGIYGPGHSLRMGGEIQSTAANGFRAVQGKYGFIIRNDGANVYFMMTGNGDPWGGWNDNYTIFTPNGEWQVKKSPYDNGMSTARGYVVVSDSNDNRVYSISNYNANYLKVRCGLNTYHCTYSNSDIRLKKNINNTSITNALSVINSIKVRQFDWKETNIHQSIGFVADELEKLDPNFSQGGGVTKDGGIDVKSVNSFYLQGYIVKALQELSSQVSDLKQENKRLKQKLNMCN